jgi:pSer/pThr/pTyr-binding forkhead associated (FHA) protein
VVRDAGSLNGTYVNRERVDVGALDDGDEIQVGRFHLTFHVGDE